MNEKTTKTHRILCADGTERSCTNHNCWLCVCVCVCNLSECNAFTQEIAISTLSVHRPFQIADDSIFIVLHYIQYGCTRTPPTHTHTHWRTKSDVFLLFCCVHCESGRHWVFYVVLRQEQLEKFFHRLCGHTATVIERSRASSKNSNCNMPGVTYDICSPVCSAFTTTRSRVDESRRRRPK